jgi:hypothetical protein
LKKKMQNSIKAKTTSLMVLLVSVFLLSVLIDTQFIGGESTDWRYDWPMFCHGPEHMGYSLCPAAPNTNQTLWNNTLPGEIISCPAVAYGEVYVGSTDGNVYCLNAATGAQIWNYTTGGPVGSSPSVGDGKVYVGSFDRMAYCLNATDGAFSKNWNFQSLRLLVLSSISFYIEVGFY